MKETDENKIAEQLRIVISRLIKVLKYQTKNDEQLSMTESSTLGLIYNHSEILPSELATKEKVTAQSMSQIINKLLMLGFIKKTASKTDKRKVTITITANGKKNIEKRRSEKQEWLTQSIVKKTSKKEKEVLVNAIKVLSKLIE